MGLGIYIGAEITAKGLLRRRPSNKELLDKIKSEIYRLIGPSLLARLVRYEEGGDTLHIFLHPAEESVEFRIHENHMLTVSAKTSSAGPGYHSFLVDILEGLRDRCGLSWDWQNEQKEFQDETGYALHRDFLALQTEMAALFRGTARLVTQGDRSHQYNLSLPALFGVVGDYFAISPMGYWAFPWFESVAQGNIDDALLAKAAQFFPWWQKDQDAQFWMNLGLVLLWVNIRWRPPKDEVEQSEYLVALECFELATKLDPQLSLPDREIAELSLLASGEDLDDFKPSSEGLGFRRGLMRQPMTGEWSVVLPGYYYSDTENDGTTVAYWFNGRTVRGSSVSFKDTPRAREELRVVKRPPKLQFSIDHLQGVAEIEKIQDGADSYWQLTGEIKTVGSMCLVTVCYMDPADEDWAMETWKSVFMPAGPTPPITTRIVDNDENAHQVDKQE